MTQMVTYITAYNFNINRQKWVKISFYHQIMFNKWHLCRHGPVFYTSSGLSDPKTPLCFFIHGGGLAYIWQQQVFNYWRRDPSTLDGYITCYTHSMSGGKRGTIITSNGRCWNNVCLMLGQRRRRWLNIKQTLFHWEPPLLHSSASQISLAIHHRTLPIQYVWGAFLDFFPLRLS